MRWSEVTSRQFADISRESVCVPPIGAVEQHGLHLPVATDYFIATALAERFDEACGDKVLVMPGVSVTCSAHRRVFARTLSIDHDAFLSIVTQIVELAAKHGFRRFLLLNAHGGGRHTGQLPRSRDLW